MSDAFETDLVRDTIARVLDDQPEDPVRAFDEMGLLDLINDSGDDHTGDARRGAESVQVVTAKAAFSALLEFSSELLKTLL